MPAVPCIDCHARPLCTCMRCYAVGERERESERQRERERASERTLTPANSESCLVFREVKIKRAFHWLILAGRDLEWLMLD